MAVVEEWVLPSAAESVSRARRLIRGALAARFSFWVGAGLAFVNPDEGDFEGGVNLLGGVGIQKGRWYPYGQVKVSSTGDAGVFDSVAVGVRF